MGASDAWVLFLDGQGDVVRQYVYGREGGDEALSVAPAPDGGIVFAGSGQETGFGPEAAAVVKLDARGRVDWANLYVGLEQVASDVVADPAGGWKPPISWGDLNQRTGIEQIIANEGITHFFAESHMIHNNAWVDHHRHESEGSPDNHGTPVNDPVWVSNNGNGAGQIAALVRDSQICRQVWSGYVGYPADGVYMEFHKRQGEKRGLRYWKLTDRNFGLRSQRYALIAEDGVVTHLNIDPSALETSDAETILGLL